MDRVERLLGELELGEFLPEPKARSLVQHTLEHDPERVTRPALVELLGHTRAQQQLFRQALELFASMEHGDTLTYLEAHPELHTPAFVELLIERGWTRRMADAEDSCAWMRLALHTSEHLIESSRLGPVAWDYYLRACAYLGNGHRIFSNYSAAASLFAEAAAAFVKGTGDPLELALLTALRSSLKEEEGALDEALPAIERARRLYAFAGKAAEARRMEVQKGRILAQLERYDEAIGTFRSVLPYLDFQEDPEWTITARHELAWALHQTGQLEEAAAVLAASRSLASGLNLLRSRWLEGRICLELGRFESAEAALVEAYHGFLAARIPREAADATLDLVLLYTQKGKKEPLAQLVAEAESLYLSLDLPEDTMATLLTFLKAARRGQATAELLRQLRVRLAKGRGGKKQR